MNDRMRISVIVPTFNRSSALRNCVESLLTQTLDPLLFEIIIVDNNSKDATKEIMKKYVDFPSHNIRYVKEPRQGYQYACNTGAKAAKAAILAYTDDDVICETRWLEELLGVYDDEQIGCAGGKIIVKWDKDPPLWVLPYEAYFGQLDETTLGSTFRILQPGEYIFGGNCSIRKSVLFELGGFGPDQVEEVYPTGDSEMGLWMRAYKKGIKIAWVPDAVVWHVQAVDKNATLSDLKRRFRNWGVVSASAAYKENPCGGLRLLLSSIGSLSTGVISKAIVAINSARTSSFDYKHELWSAFFLKKALVELDLAFTKSRRDLLLQENWLE